MAKKKPNYEELKWRLMDFMAEHDQYHGRATSAQWGAALADCIEIATAVGTTMDASMLEVRRRDAAKAGK